MSKYIYHVVPHFHYDVAFLDDFEGYLVPSFHAIEEALRLMSQHKDFTFVIEQTILLEEFWDRRPLHRDALRRFAQEGRLEVACGMYVMPDMNMISGESLARQTRRGRDWVREHLGIEVVTCWIADCFGHHPQLPQMVKRLGYRSYAFSRAMAADFEKSDFLWEGLDGTRILTHWMPGLGYGMFYAIDEATARAWGIFEGTQAEINAARLRKAVDTLTPYASTKHVLVPCGHDFRAPIDDTISTVHAFNGEMSFDTASGFFESLSTDADGLPVSKADHNPAWQGTYSTRIKIKQANARLESLLTALERLNVACEVTTGVDLQSQIEPLWQPLLKNQFHDTICGTVIDKAWRDTMGEYAGAFHAAADLQDKLFTLLDSGIGEELALTVFNPSGFARTDVIRFSLYGSSANGLTSATDESGVSHPVQEIEPSSDGNREFIFIDELPPMGIKCYTLSSAPLKEEPPTLHADDLDIGNGSIRLRFNPHSGVIDSLTLDGEELVDQGRKGFNDLVMQEDHGGPWTYYEPVMDSELRLTTPYRDPLPEEGQVPPKRAGHHSRDLPARVEVIEHGPVRVAVKITGRIVPDPIAPHQSNSEYTQFVYIYDGLQRIDFKVDWRSDDAFYRLRAAFPANIEHGRILHGIPMGRIERPEGEYAAHRYIEYRDPLKGLVLTQAGLPGNNVTDGVMMLSLMRSARMPHRDDDSVEMLERGAEHSFEYSIHPFLKDDVNPDQLGEVRNLPLLICVGLTVPAAESLFSIQPGNVSISSLRVLKDGYAVTCYENSGLNAATKMRISPVFGVTSVVEVDDLLEPIADEEALVGGAFRTEFRPFQIRSFLFGC